MTAIHSVFRLNIESCNELAGSSKAAQFLIGQGNGGGDGGETGLSQFAAEATTKFGAPLVPWGAVACPLGLTGKHSTLA